jgi:hypothetical protein
LNTPLDVGATPLPTTSYTSIATPPATQTYVTTPQLQTSNVSQIFDVFVKHKKWGVFIKPHYKKS